jgi:endo-1,4-beta-D-glucanase Y
MRISASLGIALAVSAASVASCATPPADEGPYGTGDGSGDADHENPDPDPSRCEADRDDPAVPFGSHKFPYADGAILPSTADQAALDDAVKAAYDQWKSEFLEEGCGDNRAYVAANTTDTLRTVSEAHGYGMLILAYMAGHDPDAKRLFDAMYNYFRDHPAGGALMAWAQGHNCENLEGSTSATDGDLDIAYALLLADKQWGSGGTVDYRSVARDVLDAIWDKEVDPSGSYLLLGNWARSAEPNATRTSDFMPDHLAAFAEASGDERWTTLNDREYEMIASLQENHAPDTGLLPDFVNNPSTDPEPAEPEFLETEFDGTYSWNACRDPFRLGVHYLTSGDERAKEALERLNAWVIDNTAGDPGKIQAGYYLDGTPSRNFGGSMAFNGPFGVGAMVDAGRQAWLDAIWAQTDGLRGDYYNKTLQLLTMIVMSGNWWTPAAADCPE